MAKRRWSVKCSLILLVIRSGPPGWGETYERFGQIRPAPHTRTCQPSQAASTLRGSGSLRHAVAVGESTDLLRRPRLLSTKLVAREGEDQESRAHQTRLPLSKSVYGMPSTVSVCLSNGLAFLLGSIADGASATLHGCAKVLALSC